MTQTIVRASVIIFLLVMKAKEEDAIMVLIAAWIFEPMFVSLVKSIKNELNKTV